MNTNCQAVAERQRAHDLEPEVHVKPHEVHNHMSSIPLNQTLQQHKTTLIAEMSWWT
jgi:hypothetical protein